MTNNELLTKEHTDFAPAERAERDVLLRQHQTWTRQMSTQLVSNAIPDFLLILNEQRQIVFSNDFFMRVSHLDSVEGYLGLRSGDLLDCIHATETSGGCGTTKFCRSCGAAQAVLMSISGKKDITECVIERGNNLTPINYRVWTTPVELDMEKFTIFAIQDISIEKENARLLEQVQKLAIMDPLTGIYNRRVFFDVANREIVRSIRYHNPFSVIMIDLDRFKQTNDTYGHPAGDAVIKEAVRLIKLNLREIDTFARYGGDEFIILLPETGLVGGQKVADRIMKASDLAVYRYKDFAIPVAFSAGVAEYIFDVDHDIDDVITRADEELFRVKKIRKLQPLD